MFGFTGTPIFVDNATSKASRKTTTKDLFDECLHKYTIVDAIKDENVLKFGIEYVGRYKQVGEDGSSKNEMDIDVEGIDTKELLESDKRLKPIVEYILDNHDRKTHNREFTGMFCVSSVDMLYRYYELFKEAQMERDRPLRVATIFSYTANEDDKDANDDLTEADPMKDEGVNLHSREKLDLCLAD